MFEACRDQNNPDSHNTLEPICEVCKAWKRHWYHDKDNPDRHDFVEPTEPLVWGENAHRNNACEYSYEVEPDEYTPNGVIYCECPCHWSVYYVNVYEIVQGYGGPEEGGWWYDTGTPIASIPFESYSEAQEGQKIWREKYPVTKGRYSVLDKEDWDVLIEKHYGTYFPEERPRYS